MQNSVNESAIKKLKLLITVVDRPKAEFYLDVLSQFEINCQLVTTGKGTAKADWLDMLGLSIQKAVIISFVREDILDGIMKCLENKFATVKNGKGIAFAVPLSSVIGVNMYQFLSNNRYMRGENHDNK
jgi:hypothetical protein